MLEAAQWGPARLLRMPAMGERHVTHDLRACIIAALSFSGAGASSAQYAPGTIPGNKPIGSQPKFNPEIGSGLTAFYQKFGRYQLSVSAAGSNDASHALRVSKPHADAIVEKAFLLAASNGCGHPCEFYTPTPINKGDIRLNSEPVTWQNSIATGFGSGFPEFFHNAVADVTSIVKPVLDAMPAAGNKNFTVKENAAKITYIDGEVLVVVFKMPAGSPNRTIALMFGAQQPHGDRFELSLVNPIDKSHPDAVFNMGSGISYGCQNPICAAPADFTSVKVNGRQLTMGAGGEHDGSTVNGAFITVGGIGDSPDKPANPSAPAPVLGAMTSAITF